MFASAAFMTGCEKEKKEETVEVTVPKTLTLWLPAAKGAEVDDESVVNVENAVNRFTQANFKTAVRLKVIPADLYDSYVLSKIYELKKAEDEALERARREREEKRKQKQNATTAADSESSPASEAETAEQTTEAVEDTAPETTETSIIETTNPDDYILPADADGKRPYDYDQNDYSYLNASLFTSFPAVENDQFDIFLIHGYEEFELLNNDGLLSDLTTSINNESKVLNSYINSFFFKGVKENGVISMIPNNRAAGESKVLLINKDVCKQLSYDPTMFKTFKDLFNYDDTGISFIEDVVKNMPGITPVAGEFEIPNVKYLNGENDGSFSLITAQIDRGVIDFEGFIKSITSPFHQTAFIDGYRFYKQLKNTVNSVPFGSTDDFAVGFYTGDYKEIEKYSDKYQIITIQAPQLSREEAFATGFAVSSYTNDVDRAMEIITAINTNTELRTILQYGQEGTHWRYDLEDSSIIRKLKDTYKMDINETGNVFVTYPDYGVPMSGWDEAKENNSKLYIPYSYGMTCMNSDTEALLTELTAKSKEYYDRIEAMTLEEFNSNLETLKNEVVKLECYDKLTHRYGVNPAKDEGYVYEECLPNLLNDYVNVRGW